MLKRIEDSRRREMIFRCSCGYENKFFQDIDKSVSFNFDLEPESKSSVSQIDFLCKFCNKTSTIFIQFQKPVDILSGVQL